MNKDVYKYRCQFKERIFRPNLVNVNVLPEMERPSTSRAANVCGTTSRTELNSEEGRRKRRSVEAAVVNQPVTSSLNCNIKGVGDFGKKKRRRTFEIYFTFLAPKDDDAKRLFSRLKAFNEGSILITRLSADGRTHPSYVHVYIHGRNRLNHDEFKSRAEESGLKCLEVKKVVSQTNLLMSILMPRQNRFLRLSYKMPKGKIKEIEQKWENQILKQHTTTNDPERRTRKRVETIPQPDNNGNEEGNEELSEIDERIRGLENEVRSLEQTLEEKRAQMKRFKNMRSKLHANLKERSEIAKEFREANLSQSNINL